jgi:hypothetical protein
VSRAEPPHGLKPVPLSAAVALVVTLLIAAADVARASLFLDLDRTSGRPGTVVHVRTAGQDACQSCPHRLQLYFAEVAVSSVVSSPDDPRLVRVGELIVDGRGNGRGQFTVPDVPDGRYEVLTYCVPCAPLSAGRTMLPMVFPPFRVFGSPIGRSAPMWPWILVGGGGSLIAAVTLTRLRTRKRRGLAARRHEPPSA